MKLKNPMLVVTDIDRSVEFYKKVFGLHIIMDFGANKTLTGGLALQTVETYKNFIGTNDISFGGNNFEIYFEEDDEEETFKIVSTMRGDSVKGRISNESPIGAAIMGHKVGDRVEIKVNDSYSYYVVIKEIVNTGEEETDTIRTY